MNVNLFQEQRITDHWFTAAVTSSALWIAFLLVVILLRNSIKTVGGVAFYFYGRK